MEHRFTYDHAAFGDEYCHKLTVIMEIKANENDYTWTVENIWDETSNCKRTQGELLAHDELNEFGKCCAREAEMHAPDAMDETRDRWNQYLNPGEEQ